MKTFFLAVTFTGGLFFANVEGHQQADSAYSQLVSQNERQILIQNCHQIRAQIASQFSGMGSGALHSSGFKNTVKHEITNYLQSVRTHTSLQLLNEFQANGFRDFM
jgi:hypothetical protein